MIALIRCESSFNNYAVSGVGAMGLMQVMPDTGSYLADKAGYELGRPTNLFDAETNMELGTAYLANLIERFGSRGARAGGLQRGAGRWRKKILAQRRSARSSCPATPPRWSREFRKLKAQQERELTLRAQQPTEASPADGCATALPLAG